MERVRPACTILTLLFCLTAHPAEPPKLNALLLTGQNNHNWKQTTPVLKEALEACGRFTVDVTEHPEQCTAESLAKYDVLVSNWNAWGDVPVTAWPEATRDAVLGFVREGKGFVVVHAGSSSFYDWKDYQRMTLASWALGTTGHGRPHQFYVRVTDPYHPITHGMKIFLTRDELWHRAAVQPGAKALAVAFSDQESGGSGNDEPMVLVGDFGEGRSCTLLLGHDAQAMAAAGFRVLLCRGAEWAATGEVAISPGDVSLSPEELDFVLSQVAVYEPGGRRDALLMLEYHVGQVAGSEKAAGTAQALAALVENTQATADGREFALRQLSLVGTAEQVPLLAKLLSDPRLGFHARSALQRIPGEESLAALRVALVGATGMERVGLINSLGARRDAKSVPVFARLVVDRDAETARAAMGALGRTGSSQALQALEAQRDAVPEALRLVHTCALLQCADSLVEGDAADKAKPVYERLLTAGQPDHIRGAAFAGLVACEPGRRGELVMNALVGEDAALRRSAARALRDSGDNELLAAVAARLDGLPTDVQSLVIAQIEERGVAASLPAVTKAVASEDATVRHAALSAVGVLGDATSVPVLTAAAETADRDERRIIGESLVRLRGDGVDNAIVSALQESPATAQRQLIRALIARSAKATVPALLDLADGNAEVRRDAVNAVGELGDADDCSRLLRMLKATGDADRGALEQALISICSRAQTTKPILRAVDKAEGAYLASLVGVLGSLGGADALAQIRSAAKSEDAAVRAAAIDALAAWSDAAPLGDLAQIAAAANDAAERGAAMRGVARLVPMDKARPQDELLALVARAMAAAQGPGEKKLLLPAVGSLASLAAMQTAQEHMADAALTQEASLAALQVAERIFRQHRDETAALATQVQQSENATIRERAVALLLKISKADNLAIGATATSPDGLNKDGAASGDQAAIDGNPETYWDEADGKKLYVLRVELQQPAKVSAIRLLGYQHHNFAPKDFEIVCDDKVVRTVEGAEYQDNLLTLVIPETECAAVELRITGYYGQSPAIRELEIFSRAPKG